MSGRLVAAAVLALAAPAASDQAYDRIRTLLDERRLGEAHALLPEVGDPLLAAKARAEVFYLGRDFPACVEAARAGLTRDPDELTLLYRALGSALWLRDGAAAGAWGARLSDALAQAELTPDERAWWEETLAALAADARALEEASAALERRVGRARAIALAGLAGVLVALVAFGTRPS